MQGDKQMEFNDYQNQAKNTAIYPKDKAVVYPALGLAGEAGEVANKVKKVLRDGTEIKDVSKDIASEIGDCLWYISVLAGDIGWDLESIAKLNIDKLQDRANRGKLSGSGDNRQQESRKKEQNQNIQQSEIVAWYRKNNA